MTRAPRAVILLAVVAPVAILTGRAALAQGALSQIGLTDAAARRATLAAIERGAIGVSASVPEAAWRRFLALPPAARRDVTAAAWTWLKTYVDSNAFKTEYARVRKANAPASTQYDATVDEELKQRVEKQLADLAAGLAALSALPQADRAKVEAGIRKSQAYFESQEYRDMERARILSERGKNGEDDELLTKRWSERYPADPDTLFARLLRDFLNETADVNWNARTIEYGDQRVFASAVYGTLPWQWREAFWAGREASESARSAAEAWLRELGVPTAAFSAPRSDRPMLASDEGRAPVNLSGRGGIARIVMGLGHTVFLYPDGTLQTWTSNAVSANKVGQFGLGHANPVPIDTPVPLTGLRGVVTVSAGSDCTFAVTADGTLLAWGPRMDGVLGITRPQDVGSDFIQPTDALSPTRLSVPFVAADVSASWQHVLAVTRKGDVYAWGNPEYGRLGLGEVPVLRVGTNAPRPMRVVLYPMRVPGLTGIKAVAAGREHSLALMADGTVRA